MARTAFRFLSSAWLLVLIGGAATGGTKLTTDVERIDCLKQFNKARARAGLKQFKVALDDSNSLPVAGDMWVVACTKLIEEGTVDATPTAPQEGTYAFMALSEGKADCEAAVKYWESAVNNFSGPPPVYTTAEQVYKDPINTSFVSLFNPGPSPTADCATFSCKVSGSTQLESHGLLCLSSPKALNDGKAPFTEDEWEKITVGINSPASAAAPGLLAIAIITLGIAIN